jgi:hypothetical protein
MATELRVHAYAGGIAGADFSPGGGMQGAVNLGLASGQYLIVALNGVQDTFALYVNDNPTSGRVPLGITQNDPKLGGELSVMLLGRSKLVAGAGGLAIGDEVGAEAVTGRGVKKAATLTGANLGDFVIGVCVCAAAQGETSSVELIGRYRV